MKYPLIVVIISLFIFSFIFTNVSAWYESDENNAITNKIYQNTEFDNDNMYAIDVDIDHPTDRIPYVYNLEPGYFLLSMGTSGLTTQILKYSFSGDLIWQMHLPEISANMYPFISIDDNYDIYVTSDDGLQKIDGSDGNVIWTFDNINNYNTIGNIAISFNSEKLFLWEYTTYKGYILDTNDGILTTESSIDKQYLQKVDWTYDNNLIVACKDTLYLYDDELTQLDSESIGTNNIMTIAHIDEIGSLGSNYSDYIFIGYSKTIKCYSYDGSSITNIWSVANASSYNYGNIIYSQNTHQVFIINSNGAEPSFSAGSYIVSYHWDYDDPITDNITWIWNSILFNNAQVESGSIICDSLGTVIYQKYGDSSIKILYPTTGVVRETQATTLTANYPYIYDRYSEKLLVPTVTGTWDLEFYMFNSSYTAGGDNDPVFPEQLDEETWDWILYTMLITSISAIGAFTAFNGFNQTAFLCFLNINIFIGAWYGIYPLELIIVPVAILTVLIFRTGGDVAE